LCVNAITARRAFKTDWPAEVAPAVPATPTGIATSPYASGPYSSIGYTSSRYVSVPQPYPPGYSGRYGPGVPNIPSYQGISGVDMPTINRVDQGVLYATVTPDQVVALQTRNE